MSRWTTPPNAGPAFSFTLIAAEVNVTVGCMTVYTQVLDGSVRDAVEKIGGELFTFVHRPARAGAVTA